MTIDYLHGLHFYYKFYYIISNSDFFYSAYRKSVTEKLTLNKSVIVHKINEISTNVNTV